MCFAAKMSEWVHALRYELELNCVDSQNIQKQCKILKSFGIDYKYWLIQNIFNLLIVNGDSHRFPDISNENLSVRPVQTRFLDAGWVSIRSPNHPSEGKTTLV